MVTWHLEIRHQVAIAGRVINAQDSRPIQGASVEISSAPAVFTNWLAVKSLQYEDRWDDLVERPDRTRTAADGHFHFLDLPDGNYTLMASLPASGTRVGTSEVPASVSRDESGRIELAGIDIELSFTTISGQITDFDTGDTVGLAEVRVRGDEGHAFSNGQGQYSLSGVQVGADRNRTLMISAQGYQIAYQDVLLSEAGEVHTLNVVLIASDFDPTMISDNVFWLRAGALTGLIDNDPVAVWPDGSGNGNDATQAVGNNQPTYKQRIINGMSVVRFDGQNDFMEFSFTEPSTDHTFFFVYDQTPPGGHHNYLFDAQSGRLILDTADRTAPHSLRWNDGLWRVMAEAIAGKQIVTWLLSGTTGEIFRNGLSLENDDYDPQSLNGRIALGSNNRGLRNHFDGDLAEVIYYSSALPSNEREKIERYLSNLYAVTIG